MEKIVNISYIEHEKMVETIKKQSEAIEEFRKGDNVVIVDSRVDRVYQDSEMYRYDPYQRYIDRIPVLLKDGGNKDIASLKEDLDLAHESLLEMKEAISKKDSLLIEKIREIARLESLPFWKR